MIIYIGGSSRNSLWSLGEAAIFGPNRQPSRLSWPSRPRLTSRPVRAELAKQPAFCPPCESIIINVYVYYIYIYIYIYIYTYIYHYHYHYH